MNIIKDFDEVKVFANVDSKVTMSKKEIDDGIYEYEFLLDWDEEQAKDIKSELSLVWELPVKDCQYMWYPICGPRRVLDATWRLNYSSMLTLSAPTVCLFNGADKNTYTFATDEIKKVTKVIFGLNDLTNTITGTVSMGLKQFTGKSSHRLLVYANMQKVPYYEAIDGVRAWWEDVCGIEPMKVPEIAQLPMYSSWYNFHQEIKDYELEAECKRAVELGMKAIIVDDGWQTEDISTGYAYCGDWEVADSKIANMREHVKRVHDTGLKYLLWYSVPFVGYKSKNWERFKDKIIYSSDRNAAGILDPRFPEVRQFLIGIYEHALKEYDIDGFKLDFIDRFKMQDDDVIKPGMDYTCIQEATDRLMTDVMRRLKTIKCDILIEFRQKYIGPAMRKYGNIFRVSDCANDLLTNRIGIMDLRLLSGNTAVHSDMVMWTKDESPEDAALQLLNCLFGVIQFSIVIENMSEEHRKMTAFWLDFAIKNKEVLLNSQLIPYEPHLLYPVIKAHNETEAIIGVYSNSKIVKMDTSLNNIKTINASKEGKLYFEFENAVTADVVITDCMGNVVKTDRMNFEKGLASMDVPQSGIIEFGIGGIGTL